MMNMYSVHKFYEEIVAEMHQIMTSDKKERYLLKEWDDKKAMLFNHVWIFIFRLLNTTLTISLVSSTKLFRNTPITKFKVLYLSSAKKERIALSMVPKRVLFPWNQKTIKKNTHL